MKSVNALLEDIECDKYITELNTCKSLNLNYIINSNVFEKIFIKVFQNKGLNCCTNNDLDYCKLVFDNAYYSFLSTFKTIDKTSLIYLLFKPIYLSLSSINFVFEDPYKAALFLIFNSKKYSNFLKDLLNNAGNGNYYEIAAKNFAKDINMKFSTHGSYPNKVFTFS